MKVMIGAVAALTAAVTFGDLVSANVVGYAKTDVRKGFSAVGAQFIPVNATTNAMDLCDIVPVGYGDDYEGGSIYIQMLDSHGRTVEGSIYSWYDNVYDGVTYKGWYDDQYEQVPEGKVSYDFGDALWVCANSDKEGIQSAGQVATGSLDIYLRAGFKLICNPTPVAVPFNPENIGDTHISAGIKDGDYEGGSIYVQKLDAKGRTVDGSIYSWYDNNYDGTVYYGWYNDSYELVPADVKLDAGEAIWVYGTSVNDKINFPAAIK